MEQFTTILSNFGFPVAVACYLLFRFEKKLESLEETNRKLVDRVTALAVLVEDMDEAVEGCPRNKK